MRSRTATRSIVFLSGLLAAGGTWANNLTVTKTALAAPADGKVAVRFDIAWDNSWRDGVNWDAAWVFVKYSIDGGSTWSHATLYGSGTNPAGYTNGTGTNLDIVVPGDRKGAFIQRSTHGVGAVANRGVTLWWDFATDGVSRTKSALAKAFALEMVYIPEGAFWVGNTNGVVESSFRHKDDVNSPFYIDSTNTFTIYWGTGGGSSASVSSTFPNGYAAFYLMKTEVSQRQYCDFLNTLTPFQQGTRHDAALNYSSGTRNWIKKTVWNPLTKAYFGCDANGNAGPATAVTNISRLNETNDGEWVACNYFSWADLAAYADWSGLRPITELEFEKACRGPLAPVQNEYAWGDAVLEAATSSLSNQCTGAETPNQGNCNYSACWPDGPYRCGSYSDASSGRSQAGAGYYGVLDLSGNMWERAVTVGGATGRAFTGEHGDGGLDAEGNASVALWPGVDASGVGCRGGSSYVCHSSTDIYVSDRYYASSYISGRKDGFFYGGGRAARSAP